MKRVRQSALKLAYYFGAEAAANGRKYMNKADRDQLAEYEGMLAWSDMRPQFKADTTRAWNYGHDAESRNH